MEFLPWLIALGGGSGVAAALTALASTIRAVKHGAAKREDEQRSDLITMRDMAVTERDAAVARAEAAQDDLERSRRNEQRAREYAADLRLYAIDTLGVRRDDLPPWPSMED